MTTRLRLRQGLLIAATFMLAAAAQPATAQEDESLYWGFRVAISNYSWSKLGDIQPLSGGPFQETTGIGLEGHASVSFAQWGSTRLFAGLELGLVDFGVPSDGPPSVQAARENSLSLDYIAATLSFRFGEPGNHFVEIDTGLGAYAIDSKYVDCAVIVSCFQADTDAKSEGLILGVTGVIRPGITLGAKVHLVDFDPIESVDLGVTPFDGPIYSLFVGYEFNNW